MEYEEIKSIFQALLGLGVTLVAGAIGAWIFDKITFDTITILQLIIVLLVYILAIDKTRLRMKDRRDLIAKHSAA